MSFLVQWKAEEAYLLVEQHRYSWNDIEYHWTPKFKDATHFKSKQEATDAYKASGAGALSYLTIKEI